MKNRWRCADFIGRDGEMVKLCYDNGAQGTADRRIYCAWLHEDIAEKSRLLAHLEQPEQLVAIKSGGEA